MERRSKHQPLTHDYYEHLVKSCKLAWIDWSNLSPHHIRMHVSSIRWGLNWLTDHVWLANSRTWTFAGSRDKSRPLLCRRDRRPSWQSCHQQGDWRHEVHSTFHQHMRCNTFHFHRKRDHLWNSHFTAARCLQNVSRGKCDTRQALKTHAWTRSLPCPPAHDDANLLAFFLGAQIWHSVTLPTLRTQCLLHILNTLFLTLKTHERTLIMPPRAQQSDMNVGQVVHWGSENTPRLFISVHKPLICVRMFCCALLFHQQERRAAY